MSYTPYNAPLLSGLLGDPEVAALFGVKAELDAMLRVEVALAQAQAQTGIITPEAAEAITAACDRFEPDLAALTRATARDGVVVPELVRQLRAAVGAEHGEAVHTGATSQDVTDTAMALRIGRVLGLMEERLRTLLAALDALAARHGDRVLMGRTRMQDALAITFADRIGAWRRPLAGALDPLAALRIRIVAIQAGGPVGISNRDEDGRRTVETMADLLGLACPETPWQTDRSGVADFGHWCSMVTGALGKLGQDVAMMALAGEVALASAGGSSAMAHKRNPVAAEVLVTLARFNATLVGGLHHALVHEQERSGSAWTLEWMLVPQLALAAGASTRTALALVGDLEFPEAST